jgi:Holliday junction resolvasome RuvABC endonuclease subunit
MRICSPRERWVSIDPGLKRTGWASWAGTALCDWGLVTAKDIVASDFRLTASIMADRVRAVLQRHRVDVVVSEMPEEHMSGRGRAALNSGSVRKLAYYVGVLHGVAAAGLGAMFHSIEPSRWKGTVPKEVTTRRVIRAYPQVPEGLWSDTYDAIAIGRWRVRKGESYA